MQPRRLALLLVVAVCFFGSLPTARGQIYMYRDKQGTLHFSNAPAQPGFRRYTPQPGMFARGRARRADPGRHDAFDQIISNAARRYDVDSALIKAVIRAESDFVPYARSPKGALGLMQLTPATALRHNVGRVFEPSENIHGGVKHLRLLLDRYNGNVRLALAAYNAGERAVARYGGIPPYPETIEYLDRVLRFREFYIREQ